MTMRERVLLVALVIQVLVHPSLTQQVETDPELLVVKGIHSIEQSLSYFIQRGDKIEVGELLGLRIAAAALARVVEHCVGTPEVYVPKSIVENVKELCAKMNVLIPRILNIYNPSNMTEGLSNFMSSDWKRFLPYRSINVEKENRRTLETLEQAKLADFLNCLGDLIQVDDKNCILSDRCLKVLQPKIAKEAVIPYQAMVLSMVELVGCSSRVNEKWDPVTLDQLADDICYSLYPKVSAFHASNIPQEKEEIISFLEAFFACSLLGFEDFLHVTHLRLPSIVEWQLPSGCFGISKTCVPSMSSAAIGQLSLYISWLMDPHGYASSTGQMPFKRTTWFQFIVKISLIVAILIPFFVRKVRRGILVMFGRILSFFKSIFRL